MASGQALRAGPPSRAIGRWSVGDTRNLWPEHDTPKVYRASAFVHNDKDQVESFSRDAICDGKASLHAVQVHVAGDWTTATARLHLPAIKQTR